MAIRLLDTEHLVAAGFGAGDALIAAKVTGAGPGGIPWPVLYEATGVVIGLFGEKAGVPANVRDTMLLSSLALGGARLTRAALGGRLMAGPKAWGGDAHGGDFTFADPGQAAGGGQSLPGNTARIRAMNGRGGGWSVQGGFVPVFEAPGVAG